jgi:hypothetical protein
MPPIRPELLDELLKDYQKPEDLLGQDGLLQQLTKALVERALDGELTYHLGYEKHDSADDNSGNSRNGTTPKTMKGKRGQVQIDVPRDRNSEFEPQLVKKGQTRFDGFLLEISGTTVTWTERGTPNTMPGAALTRAARLMVSGGKLRIERANDNEALIFAGYQPQSLRDAIVAKSPQPSFIVFTRNGDKLSAEWNGLIVTKKPNGSLNDVIHPGVQPAKSFTFRRIP